MYIKTVYHSVIYTNVMVHRLSALLAAFGDLLLPRRAEVKLVEAETPATFIRFYTPHTYNGNIALSHYQETPVRAAIHATKFYHDRHAAKLLAHLLDRHLAGLSGNTIIAPLPLSPRRERERGHNQIVTVLSFCSQPLARNHLALLKRIQNTQPQSHLSRSERLKNVRHCFAPTPSHNLQPDTEILVIDDVLTTGATLSSAVNTLRQTYPHLKVSGLALAH